MNLNHNDLAVMEEALRAAMANESDYQAIYAYEELLNKLHASQNSGIDQAQRDGIRYDYDDASDLY